MNFLNYINFYIKLDFFHILWRNMLGHLDVQTIDLEKFDLLTSNYV